MSVSADQTTKTTSREEVRCTFPSVILHLMHYVNINVLMTFVGLIGYISTE